MPRAQLWATYKHGSIDLCFIQEKVLLTWCLSCKFVNIIIVADCFSQTIRQKSSKAGGTGPILRVNEDISLKKSCSFNNSFRAMYNLQ